MSLATERYVALLEFHAKLRKLGLTGNIELTVKKSEFMYWLSDEAATFRYGAGMPKGVSPESIDQLTVMLSGGVAIIRKGRDE